MSDATTFYGEEKNLKALCDFLRSSEGPAVREAIEMDKRVYYLKGESSKHLIEIDFQDDNSMELHHLTLSLCHHHHSIL
jgi:hypothetical protein